MKVFVWSLDFEDFYVEPVPYGSRQLHPDDEAALQELPDAVWHRYTAAEQARKDSRIELREYLHELGD